jgi:hypothetical protein
MTRTWKLISAGAGIASMLAVMGISSYAQFTANGSMAAGTDVPTFTAGTLGITPGSFTGNWIESEVDQTDPQMMWDSISNMAPGDTWSQTVTVTNTGSLPEYYQVSVTPNGNLFTESFSANGVPSNNAAANVNIQVATSSGYTNILGPVDASTQAGVDGNYVLINPGETETLLVSVTLPLAANNAYQGQSGSFSIDFNAVQSDNNSAVTGAVTDATPASA